MALCRASLLQQPPAGAPSGKLVDHQSARAVIALSDRYKKIATGAAEYAAFECGKTKLEQSHLDHPAGRRRNKVQQVGDAAEAFKGPQIDKAVPSVCGFLLD